MKTRKIRRTSETPTRYGTLEVSKGDVIDVPAGVASQLVKDKDEGWEFVSPAAEPAAEPVQTSAPTTSRRASSGGNDPKEN